MPPPRQSIPGSIHRRCLVDDRLKDVVAENTCRSSQYKTVHESAPESWQDSELPMVDRHHCGSFFHRSGLTIRREESLANYARIKVDTTSSLFDPCSRKDANMEGRTFWVPPTNARKRTPELYYKRENILEESHLAAQSD